MRIISGKYKGRRLTAPKKLPVRPTTDFAKEALFNILNNHYYFDGLSVLDLFAGTGNISYEFASRGSSEIVCVDADAGCIQFISKTAKELEMPILAVRSDVIKFLEKNTRSFDVIFADPPYDLPFEIMSRIPELVFQADMLLEDGVLVMEHSKHTDMSTLPFFTYDKKYGGSVFSFFEKA